MSEGTGENKADQGVTDTAGHSTGGEEKNDGPSSLPKGHPQQPDEDEEESGLVIDEAKPGDTSGNSGTGGGEGPQRPGSSAADETDKDEKEFEPTIEMIMNDFDDEATMEEEEAMGEEDDEDELSALNAEGEMPLEELLKLYGGGGGSSAAEPPPEEKKGESEKGEVSKPGDPAAQPSDKPSAEDISNDSPSRGGGEKQTAGDKRSRTEGPGEEGLKPGETAPGETPAKKNKSELARFYETAIGGGDQRALRSSALPVGDESVEGGEGGDGGGDGGSEGEGSDEGETPSWKKTIMIGPSYQASVPSGLSSYCGDTLPYENEDKLLWNPHSVTEKDAEGFLAKSQESLLIQNNSQQQPTGNSGQVAAAGGAGGNNAMAGLPLGAHVRDDEQALFLLLQCGYNSDEALRRRRMSGVPHTDTMSLWSEEECRAFELGLRLYGKDFHMIQQQKVRTRSVGELVQFYYLWKKTERHDVFATATRLEKKKYALHPGTTDYMDRFIDEQDRDIGLGLDWTRSSSSPASNYNSLLFDTRKGMSLKSAENGSSSDPVIAAAAAVASTTTAAAAASAANPNSSSSQQASTAASDPSILASGNGSSVQSVPSDNSQKQS